MLQRMRVLLMHFRKSLPPDFLQQSLFFSFLTFFLDKKSNKKVKDKRMAPPFCPASPPFPDLPRFLVLSSAMIVAKGKTPLHVISVPRRRSVPPYCH